LGRADLERELLPLQLQAELAGDPGAVDRPVGVAALLEPKAEPGCAVEPIGVAQDLPAGLPIGGGVEVPVQAYGIHGVSTSMGFGIDLCMRPPARGRWGAPGCDGFDGGPKEPRREGGNGGETGIWTRSLSSVFLRVLRGSSSDPGISPRPSPGSGGGSPPA